MNQGSDFNVTLIIFSDAGPIDITNYNFLGQIRSTTDPAAVVIGNFSFAIQNQETNTGQVQMSLSSTENEMITTSVATSLIQNRTKTPCMYDVNMEDSLGNVVRILQGRVFLSPEVTMENF